jgi:hypothetical protein
MNLTFFNDFMIKFMRIYSQSLHAVWLRISERFARSDEIKLRDNDINYAMGIIWLLLNGRWLVLYISVLPFNKRWIYRLKMQKRSSGENANFQLDFPIAPRKGCASILVKKRDMSRFKLKHIEIQSICQDKWR